MDWDDAKFFLAIAREGQMLGAARRMNVSQARLSRRLQNLESALGARLFDRSTRGCRLTDAGEVFFATAERIEAEMLTAAAQLNAADQALTGVVRIGAPDGLGSAFLAPRLGRLAERHPQLRVQLAPLPRNFSLSAREADLAVLISRPQKGRLVSRKLVDYTLGLYASRAYLHAHGAPQTLEALREYRLIGHIDDLLYTPELNYAVEFLAGWSSAIEISTAIGQFEAVRSGAGVGVLHDFMARGEPDLVRLFPNRSAERSYWLAWHENVHSLRRVAVVADWISETIHAERRCFRI